MSSAVEDFPVSVCDHAGRKHCSPGCEARVPHRLTGNDPYTSKMCVYGTTIVYREIRIVPVDSSAGKEAIGRRASYE